MKKGVNKMKIKGQKILYHLTNIENLSSIFNYGLCSRLDLINLGGKFVDIADTEILKKRKLSSLDKLIPFHFTPYNAFDAKILGQNRRSDFIYICIYRSFAKENGFKIIPQHPLHKEFEILDYDEGFEKINWDLMEKKMEDIPCDLQGEARQVKMAECVGLKKVNFCDFSMIFCSKDKIESLKDKYGSFCNIESGVWLNDN